MRENRQLRLATIAALATILVALPSAAQEVASFEKNLTVHKLPNGLTF